MACVGNCYGLSKSVDALLDDQADRISGFNRLHSLSIPKLAVKNRCRRVRAVAAVVSGRHVSNQAYYSTDADLKLADRIVHDDHELYDTTLDISGVPDKLDDWIRGSVTEIIKNITQAPLLLQIYANGEVKTEKAVKRTSWPNVITETSSSPDGIILVEELAENRDHESNRELNKIDGTRAFGVLIQGKIKGRNHCKSACYLLKTDTVNDGGTQLSCSHYCLMKVKNLRESASSQFKSCWLV